MKWLIWWENNGECIEKEVHSRKSLIGWVIAITSIGHEVHIIDLKVREYKGV